MAESKNNVVTHGLSGKVGDILVFRKHGDKTIVASAPSKRTGEPTERQKKQQERFQEATLYGQTALSDPTMKAEYKAAAQTGQTAFNVAVADYFNAPDIKDVDVSAYTGKAGDLITIKATDDFRVASVNVAIYNEDGSEVEHGLAVQKNKVEWVYTATTDNPSLNGDKIVITASDLPGNVTEKEETL
jgi:hypothetical protein